MVWSALCRSKFYVSTTQAFSTSNRLGWCFDDKEKLTNFETTVTGSDIALDMSRSFFTPLIWSWSDNFDVMSVESEPATRSALTWTICDLLDTFNGSTCGKMVIFGKLFFLWLMLLLIDTCCWSCLWRRHGVFFPLVVWVFEKCFLHNFSFVAKSIFSSTDLSLNWKQSIRWCFCLHNQQLILYWFYFCFPPSSAFFTNLCSLFRWFVCILYVFLINWSLTCWCVLLFVSCIKMISANGLKRSFIRFSSDTSNRSRLVVP